MKKALKIVYHSLPLKQQFFSIIKSFWSPPERIYKHLSFKGMFTVKLSKEHSFKIYHHGYLIENEVFWSGFGNSWEKESLKLWAKLCKDSNVILDIGANTGVYALTAQTLNPQAQVFAFEPVNRVYKKLNKNIKLNNYPISSYDLALSNTSGEALIYDTNDEHTYSVTVNKNCNTSNASVIETKIQTITLDDFVKQKSLDRIDLMKIDVETHEAEVLEGFKNNLLKFKPTMLIEILNDKVAQNIGELIKDCGYLYFNINENGGVKRVDSVSRSDYYNFLFCTKDVARKIGLL